MLIRWRFRPVVSEALRVVEDLIEALRQPPVVWTLAAIAGLLALRLVAGTPAVAQPLDVYDFALTGDQLYGREGEAKYPALQANIDAAPLAFVVFGGDFKNGSTVCDDATFEDRLSRFEASAHPFVFLPGDNEWTDCHRANNGGYDPVERLTRLRQMFFPLGRSLGRSTMPLENQSEKFVENVRWTLGDVLYVGLDIQGSNNNLGRTPEQDAEYAERNQADLAWLHQSFALARRAGSKAVMVIIQADPGFPLVPDELDRTRGYEEPEGPSGFADFLAALEQETLDFDGKPVVLAHGDSHYFRHVVRASTPTPSQDEPSVRELTDMALRSAEVRVKNTRGVKATAVRLDIRTETPIEAVTPRFPHQDAVTSFAADRLSASVGLAQLALGDELAIDLVFSTQTATTRPRTTVRTVWPSVFPTAYCENCEGPAEVP